jgi:hypothetical protein
MFRFIAALVLIAGSLWFVLPSTEAQTTSMNVLVRRNGVTTAKTINFGAINQKVKAANGNLLREQGRSIATPGSYGTCQVNAQACPDPFPYLDQVNGCAGWRFSRNLTATAAHCVFNRTTGTFNTPTYVYNNRGGAGEYACTVKSTTISAAYPSSTGLDHDWALIENDCPANASLGWYGFYVAPIPLYNAPLMRHHGYYSGNNPFYSDGLFSSHSSGSWRTGAFVQPGFSGGPVKGLDPIFGYAAYCQSSFPGCSIGIHSGGTHTAPGAVAYRIDESLFGVMMSLKRPQVVYMPAIVGGGIDGTYGPASGDTPMSVSPLESPLTE